MSMKNYQKQFKGTTATSRAVYTPLRTYLVSQNWIARHAARKLYPYFCIDAHVSTLRAITRRETPDLLITTSEAIVAAGQTFMKQMKRQFGGITSRRFSERLRKINSFKKSHSEAGNTADVTTEPSIDGTAQEVEHAVALIAVDEVRDELNTTSGMMDDSVASQPSSNIESYDVSSAEKKKEKRVKDTRVPYATQSIEELRSKYKHLIRKRSVRVPAQDCPLSLVPATTSVPPLVTSSQRHPPSSLASTSTGRSKQAHHDTDIQRPLVLQQ